jgi:hypothetical protein
MKKCITFLLLFFLFIVNSGYGQDYSICAGLGYGFYNMGSLESLQGDIATSIRGIELKAVDSFPPYFNFHFIIMRSISSDKKAGIFFSFLSTGGRNTISDYSGEIRVDQVINGYNFGFAFERQIFKNKIDNLFFTAKLSYIYSALSVEQYIRSFDQSASQTMEFSSGGVGLEPGFSYEIISSPIIIRTEVGFFVNLTKDFHLKSNSDATLQGIHPDWTGLRLGITAGIQL